MRKISLILVFIFSFQNVWAATEWKLASTELTKVNEIFAFKGYFYKYEPTVEDKTTLNRSADGVNWQPGGSIPTGASTIIVRTTESGIFLCGVGTNKLYYSTDATNWTLLYTANVPSTLGLNDVTDVIYYKEKLYVALTYGTVFVGQGAPPAMTWTRVSSFESTIRSVASFVAFKGKLHLCISENDSFVVPLSHLYEMNDLGVWNLTPVSTIDWSRTGRLTPYVFFAADQDRLYVGFNRVWWTDGNVKPYVWNKDLTIEGTYVAPINVFGRMQLISYFPNNNYTLERDNKWVSSPSPSNPAWLFIKNKTISCVLGNKAMLNIYESLWTMQLGLKDIGNSFISPSLMYSSSQNNTVLRFTINANFYDGIKFAVVNAGSAIQGRDIKHVKLQRILSPTQSQFLAEFNADNANPSRWVLNTSVDVEDKDDLMVTVDVADQPLNDSTISFSIDSASLQSTNNTAATLSNPVIGPLMNIKNVPLAASGPVAIDGALIYPQPGKGLIMFAYDLTVPSDIVIKIYDRSGALVSEVQDPGKSAGLNVKTQWDASTFGAGTYMSVITIKGNDGSKRVIKKKIYLAG
jgi:hypothetical protein